MAKLKNHNNEIDELLDIIQDIKLGNVGKPIDCNRFSKLKPVFDELETLRTKILVQRNQQFEKIEQEKTLVANITHDLKTPLALISGFAESLQDGMDDKDYLSLIQEKTSYMNDLVLKIIESTKQELNELPSIVSKIALKDFVQAEIKKYESLAKTKSIKIEIKRLPKTNVYIDSQKIARVLQNLISNSIKYTNVGGKIVVRGYVKDSLAHITVSDNGIGIEKEKIPYVFNKFYIDDKARSESSSTGLGLFVSKEIVEQGGGTISVKSRIQKGSEFDFSMPIYNQHLLKSVEDKVGKTANKFLGLEKYKDKPLVYISLKICLIPIYLIIMALALIFSLSMTVLNLLITMFIWTSLFARIAFTLFCVVYFFYGLVSGFMPVIPVLYLGIAFCMGGFSIISSQYISKLTKKIHKFNGWCWKSTMLNSIYLFTGKNKEIY